MQAPHPALASYLGKLENEGPAGLDFLNARVPHRYTGVYRLDGDLLRNVYLFDKRHAVLPASLATVRLQDSFCQFVLRDGEFVTGNSSTDTRLNGHPYQGVVNAYIGLPLVDQNGALFGTLCHVDMVRYDIPDGEYAFLQQAAVALAPYLVRS